MGVKVFRPVTPSARGTVLSDKSLLSKKKPVKTLVSGKKSSGGRNSFGRVTVRSRGGGHKRKYRCVDFVRNKKDGIFAVIRSIDYDPGRSAFIALIEYGDGELSYILAPHGLQIGDKVVSSSVYCDIVVGNCMPLGVIPVGTVVHNIEYRPGGGGSYARAAGCSAQIIGRDSNRVLVRLRSGSVVLLLSSCRATVGGLSNPDHRNRKIGKAGRSRWMGRRSSVRGVAMNPIDHPHGGGEGKTSGGRHPVTPWGVCTKGKKTRKAHKFSNKFVKKVLNKR